MKITKYPDGTSYVSNPTLGQQVFRINNYEDLWHLNQFVDAFHSEFSTSTKRIKPNIIIPNLIDAQADRRFNKGESSGLKLVCKFLNDLEANFSIFHPHNSEIVEGLIDDVEIIDNSEFIEKVLDKLAPVENLILMSSDAGGFKPLMKLCDKLHWRGEVASASKSREHNDGKSILTQLIAHSNFRGKDILIIDDICIYGNTFKGLSKMLRERNCGKLYLAVSHMTVRDLSEDPVTKYFDTVFTTNSKYDSYETYAHNNLEIIKLF